MRIMTLLSAILLFNIASAQNSITGFVYDPQGIPLDSISIIGDFDQPESTMTDSAGFYQFQFELDYVVGDVNGSDSYNGLDITYGVSFLKGGPAPVFEFECTPGNTWFISADVNASCSYNGLDITYGVSFFKGGPLPEPCPDCPSETADTNGIIITVYDPAGIYNTNIKRAAFGDTLEHILINVDTTQGGFDMNSFLMLQFENQAYNTRMINTNDIPNAEPPIVMANYQSIYPDWEFTLQELDSLAVADSRDSLWTQIFNMGYKGSHWDPANYMVGDVFDPNNPDSNAVYIMADRSIPDLGIAIAVGNADGVVIRGGIILNAGYDRIIRVYKEEAADCVFMGEQEESIPAESINDPTDPAVISPWDIIRFERANNHAIGTTVYDDPTLGWTFDETTPTAPLGSNIEEALENLTRNNKNREFEILDENYIISFSKGMSEQNKEIMRYLLNSKENKIKMFPEFMNYINQ